MDHERWITEPECRKLMTLLWRGRLGDLAKTSGAGKLLPLILTDSFGEAEWREASPEMRGDQLAEYIRETIRQELNHLEGHAGRDGQCYRYLKLFFLDGLSRQQVGHRVGVTPGDGAFEELRTDAFKLLARFWNRQLLEVARQASSRTPEESGGPQVGQHPAPGGDTASSQAIVLQTPEGRSTPGQAALRLQASLVSDIELRGRGITEEVTASEAEREPPTINYLTPAWFSEGGREELSAAGYLQPSSLSSQIARSEDASLAAGQTKQSWGRYVKGLIGDRWVIWWIVVASAALVMTIIILIVTSDPVPSVSLVAMPEQSPPPLSGVGLLARVSGPVAEDAPLTYTFRCNVAGDPEEVVQTTSQEVLIKSLCAYEREGTYFPAVEVSGPGFRRMALATISVADVSPALDVSLKATTRSGPAPLKIDSFTAEVSGFVQGMITLRFDCLGRGLWDAITTTSSVVVDLEGVCEYPSPGIYTPRVEVERSGLRASATLPIEVFE